MTASLKRPHCPVCAEPLVKSSWICPSCATPHHAECRRYAGGCAIFGCRANLRHPRAAKTATPCADAKSGAVCGRIRPRRITAGWHLWFALSLLGVLGVGFDAVTDYAVNRRWGPYLVVASHAVIASAAWLWKCRRAGWRRRFWLGAGVAALVLWFPTPGLDFGFRARHESCANCRSFLNPLFQDHAEAHDGWFPSGGTDPLDSLGIAARQLSGLDRRTVLSGLTSHAGSARLFRSFATRQTFTWDDAGLYNYNEGLRLDDPYDLIVLYSKEPTTWECSSHPGHVPGRVCLLVGGCYGPTRFEFLAEGAFLECQARTLAHVRARAERAADRPSPSQPAGS